MRLRVTSKTRKENDARFPGPKTDPQKVGVDYVSMKHLRT